jgi:8-oxo-dGTP pyrophosphatase MutT (NUDIX family)
MSARDLLLATLRAHQPWDAGEAEMQARMCDFVAAHPDCAERSLAIGHLTASAWVVSPDRSQVLLVLHRKLDKWLQPGGHADGNLDLLAVALQEVWEETGLRAIPLHATPYDLDVHLIPARAQDPAHDHFDVRFLLEADPATPLAISAESRALRWVPLEQIAHLNGERSITRMVERTPRPM